jgi:hypothetical protein
MYGICGVCSCYEILIVTSVFAMLWTRDTRGPRPWPWAGWSPVLYCTAVAPGRKEGKAQHTVRDYDLPRGGGLRASPPAPDMRGKPYA